MAKKDIYKVKPMTEGKRNITEGLLADKRLNRQRSVFPSIISLQKALYLATTEIIKKWTLPLRNWGKVYGELCIMYGEQMEQ